jgi:hypothetical protein
MLAIDPGAWMRSNLTTQGYFLSDPERRELSVALRFSTGLCLALVVIALALASPGMVLGGLLASACATVTATNLCIPSEALAWWERHATRRRGAAERLPLS